MMYKYYSRMRPISPGTFPNQNGNKPIEIVNFDNRQYVENDSFMAWGYLIYANPLTKEQIEEYELRNAIIKETNNA